METARPPPGTQDSHPCQAPDRYDEHIDVQALLEENSRLKELVIQLSKLVIKNVVDGK